MPSEPDEDHDEEDWILCQACGCYVLLDACDVGGACPGNVFCANCDEEIGAWDGDLRMLCGKCDWCRDMQIEGNFAAVNAARAAKISKSSPDVTVVPTELLVRVLDVLRDAKDEGPHWEPWQSDILQSDILILESLLQSEPESGE